MASDLKRRLEKLEAPVARARVMVWMISLEIEEPIGWRVGSKTIKRRTGEPREAWMGRVHAAAIASVGKDRSGRPTIVICAPVYRSPESTTEAASPEDAKTR